MMGRMLALALGCLLRSGLWKKSWLTGDTGNLGKVTASREKQWGPKSGTEMASISHLGKQGIWKRQWKSRVVIRGRGIRKKFFLKKWDVFLIDCYWINHPKTQCLKMQQPKQTNILLCLMIFTFGWAQLGSSALHNFIWDCRHLGA